MRPDMLESVAAHLPRAIAETAEGQRLATARAGVPWRRWGPYLSERQWGTVREDYSEYGTAWDYFPHDHARSRAYRWDRDRSGGGALGRHADAIRACLEEVAVG